ncbi:polysaccharide deacetylase family protein [uncultured Bacteroides sp.]|uniref:polysaccharide deacetylase family protein n=1 Tax=uncultured Bacteroides sp. TaxID=162156 RepID=UPI0025F39DA1|nr:polysaccharide deacetylase family protein [uncultured Bacteroides sp.]
MKTFSLSILIPFFCAFGINTLSAADWKVYVAKYKQNKTCAISYTFDDGLAEHSTVAAPELEKRGFRGTFWVCGYYTEQGASSKLPRMTWGELKKMAKNGHEISNHGWSHKNAKRLTLEQVKSEIEKNDSAIFANIGVMPVTYCYPYNYKTDEIVALASKNRVGTRTKQISIGGKSTPQRFDKWLADLMKKEDWGVGMTHGINHGYDAFKDPALFWAHLDKVKSLEDKIWVGTFREVSAYIKEREDIQLNVSTHKKGLTITPEMTLDKKLFTEPLTLVLAREELEKEVKKVSVKQGGKTLSPRIAGDKILFDFNPYAGKIKVNFSYK